MKVLILNSDSPNNMGDAAILAGNIKLVRSVWPDADITAVSEFPERDADLFGIGFIRAKVYTVNPVSIMKLAILSRSYNLVLWGGGELLKDYTNILGNIYWFLRILIIRIFNKNILGAFQGIGETRSSVSKFFICRAVSCCHTFILRDEESYKKLLSWGVRNKLVSSFDPAVMCSTALKGDCQHPVPKKHAVGVGARNWFHYRPGGIIPYKYRKSALRKGESDANIKYTENLSLLLDMIVDKYDVDIIFFPMFNALNEGDDAFSCNIKAKMRHSGRVTIMEKEKMSPFDYIRCMSSLQAFIGIRLHSAILAACARVPFFILHYSGKGRIFSEQLGMGGYAKDINEFLHQKDIVEISDAIGVMIKENSKISHDIDRKISFIGRRIEMDFKEVADKVR